MLGTLDFTVSEHWAPFNFPWSTALHRILSKDLQVRVFCQNWKFLKCPHWWPTTTALQSTLFKTDTIATIRESSAVKKMLGTDVGFSFREMSVLQVCLWRDWTVLPTNSSDCLLGERFKVKMGLPEWYTNDAVAQYLVQWVIFPFLSVRTEYLALLVSLQWQIQGRGPGKPPPYF